MLMLVVFSGTVDADVLVLVVCCWSVVVVVGGAGARAGWLWLVDVDCR